jgi:hypothetical protein
MKAEMQTDEDKMNAIGSYIELQPVRKIGRHIENRRVEMADTERISAYIQAEIR